MDPNIPLKIESLDKFYGSLKAVNKVSFEVKPGEIFGLLGPNGAGKTSIISSIITLCTPTNGRVLVFGKDVSKDPKKTKMVTGCVPQELINHGFFSLEEILHIHSSYYGILNNQKQVNFLIDRLSLREHCHHPIKRLSGGMKRRLLIAKALVHKPKLLLLDEPTAGVDVELRATLWEFVRELRDQGVSVLLTTHYLEEAEELCDRIGILDHGVLKMIGKTKEIIRQNTAREIIFLLNSPLKKIENKYLKSQTDSQLTFKIPAYEDLGSLINSLAMDLNKIKDMRIKEGRLEDAFQSIVNTP